MLDATVPAQEAQTSEVQGKIRDVIDNASLLDTSHRRECHCQKQLGRSSHPVVLSRQLITSPALTFFPGYRMNLP